MGILTRIFSMLAAKPLTKSLEKAMKTAIEDEEVKASLEDFQESRHKTMQKMANYCENNPDAPLCYGAYAKKFGFDFNPKRKKGDKSRWMHKGKKYSR